VSLRPQRHSIDQKIWVHVFYCVPALLLCGLRRRELHSQRIDRSIPTLLEDLGQIREAGILSSGPSESRRLEMTLSRLTEEQRRLYGAQDLGRYASPYVIRKSPLKWLHESSRSATIASSRINR
jgi:hypothetical protein